VTDPSSLKLCRDKATQHIEAPTKAKKYPYWITKAGFVVKVNFLGRDCNFSNGETKKDRHYH
jgi:hypothetical protein